MLKEKKAVFTKQRAFWIAFLSLVLIIWTVFIYAPLLVLALNKTKDAFSLSQFLPVLGVILLSLLVLAGILFFLCRSGIFRRVALPLFVGLALYIGLAVNVFPLSTGVLTGHNVQQSLVQIAPSVFLFIVCITGAYLIRETTAFLLRVLFLLTLLATIYCAESIPRQTNTNESIEKLTAFGSKHNVVILVIEMLQGQFMKELLEQKPQVKDIFRDFIFFDNAVSAGPFTMASTTALLAGDARILGDSIATPTTNNLLHDAVCDGYDTRYVTYNVPVKTEGVSTFTSSALMKRRLEVLKLADVAAFRYLPAQLARKVALSRTPIEFGWLSKVDDYRSFLWFAQNAKKSECYDRTFTYYHCLFTHYPVRFDANGVYSDKRSFDDLYGEIELLAKTIGVFLDSLRAAEVYDNTDIIIAGDHGYDRLWWLSTDILARNSHLLYPISKELRVGQYDVALLMKPQGYRVPFHYDSTPVSLVDLRAAVVASINNDNVLSSFNNFRNLESRTVDVRALRGGFIDENAARNSISSDNWVTMNLTLPLCKHYCRSRGGEQIRISPGTLVPFHQTSELPVLDGFWDAESWGRWIKDDEIELTFACPFALGCDLWVSLGTRAFLTRRQPRQTLSITSGPAVLGNWRYDLHMPQTNAVFVVPAALRSDNGAFTLTLTPGRAVSPKEAKVSSDVRRLSIGLHDIVVRPIGPTGENIIYVTEELVFCGQTNNMLVLDGFWPVEKWGRWLRERKVSLRIVPNGSVSSNCRLRLDTMAFVSLKQPHQYLEIKTGNTLLGRWEYEIGKSSQQIEFDVPAVFRKRDGSIQLVLQTGEPHSPYETGRSDDRRPLAIGLCSLRLVDVSPD